MKGKPKFRLTLNERDAVALYQSIDPHGANDTPRASKIDGALYDALVAAGVDV
jgi:hypothetical protein